MIEVKNVTKKYGKFVAVDDANFKIKDNEVVGFLGPNGAGKTTTMNMLTGYIEPSKGKIIINGFDISKSPKKAKRQIGYMPENVPLYNELTVKEFINYMAELKDVKRKERIEQVDKIIEETGLTNVKDKLIKRISRGYKQRVSLAGALIGNPPILILDEPTVGLDPKQITDIRKLIKKLGKNHTVILSSHILSEVSQICKKVIIINKGKILAIDTPENLEDKTKSENSIIITVEDNKNKMEKLSGKIKEIKDVKLIKDNEDGTKQFLITSNREFDIRKKIFEILSKENITIFELKQSETTLEDAFLNLINNKELEIEKERKAIERAQEKRNKKLYLMSNSERKNELKKEKKEEKLKKKIEFDLEWEKEKELIKEEKEEKKKAKLKEKNKSKKKVADKKDTEKKDTDKKYTEKKDTKKKDIKKKGGKK